VQGARAQKILWQVLLEHPYRTRVRCFGVRAEVVGLRVLPDEKGVLDLGMALCERAPQNGAYSGRGGLPWLIPLSG
jgi:hypothetical protein